MDGIDAMSINACLVTPNTRVLLKGPWLVLGESYSNVSTMNQLKNMLDTLLPIFIIFRLLKASQNRLRHARTSLNYFSNIMDVLGRFGF